MMVTITNTAGRTLEVPLERARDMLKKWEINDFKLKEDKEEDKEEVKLEVKPKPKRRRKKSITKTKKKSSDTKKEIEKRDNSRTVLDWLKRFGFSK